MRSDDEEPDYEESQSSLAAVAVIRTELTRGDLRPAYLAWLLALQSGDVADDDTEPFVPSGLRALTAAQTALIEFLRIDADLLAVAAEASPARERREQAEAVAAWRATKAADAA